MLAAQVDALVLHSSIHSAQPAPGVAAPMGRVPPIYALVALRHGREGKLGSFGGRDCAACVKAAHTTGGVAQLAEQTACRQLQLG